MERPSHRRPRPGIPGAQRDRSRRLGMTKRQQPQGRHLGVRRGILARHRDEGPHQSVDFPDQLRELGRRQPQTVEVKGLCRPPVRRLLAMAPPGMTGQLLVAGECQLIQRERRTGGGRGASQVIRSELKAGRRRPPRTLTAIIRDAGLDESDAPAPAGDSCSSTPSTRQPPRAARQSARRRTSTGQAAQGAADARAPATPWGRSRAAAGRGHLPM